jgi:hypothetical protein
MLRPKALLLASAALLPLLGGCDTIRDTFGTARQAPNEFEVVTRAPLTVPPGFQLRPPEPGAPRPQEQRPRDAAQAALTGASGGGPGNAAGNAGRSAGETALLRAAKAENADSSIRQVINTEYTQLAEKDESFVDRLIFWQKQPPPGDVINPGKEQARIREKVAEGEPVTGQGTPSLVRRKRAILEGIF